MCGLGAGLSIIGAFIAALQLHQGTMGQRMFVGVFLALLVGLGLLLLYLEQVKIRDLCYLALPLALAMLVRCLLMDHQSDDYLTFLSQWYEVIREGGGFAAISQPVGNYNVPYLYFIALISYLNVPNLYLYKLFSVFLDVILAWGGLRVVRVLVGEKRSLSPLVAFSVLLFVPTVVLNGSYWAQCDVIYGALVVHAVASLLEGRNKWSLVWLALAFSFKLQTVFIMPLWGVLWLAGRVKFRELFVFPGVYALTAVPALLLGKPLGDILGVYLGQMGEYDRLTLNAPTVYQFLPQNGVYDQSFLSQLGIIAAMIVAFAMLFVGVWKRKQLDNQMAMAVAMVLVVGIPFFLPHMHERYFYLADVLAVCWAVANVRRIPVAVLVCGSSLASYSVYLRLKYNYILYIAGDYLVMFWETAAMAAALALCLYHLVTLCRRGEKQ
ncbi:hypothetical protein B5G37_04870 [Pseudoflavonifractor sp. An85]|nr:hypothetical protein B5G37_04870 [Pseudoflavonifractor sp. An85]